MEHEIGYHVTVLPYYRVTVLPCYQEPTNCSYPETDYCIRQHLLYYY